MVSLTTLSPKKPNKLTVRDAILLDKENTSASLTVGTNWYLISLAWWNHFMEEKDTGNESDVINMPAISNESLVEFRDGEYNLKPKLVEGLNYALVPENIFNTLQLAYGVASEERDIIKRAVVPDTLLRRHPFVEIYLRDLKIANFSNPENTMTIQISHADSIERIREKMMQALSINEEKAEKLRFITEDEAGAYEQLPPTISNVKLSSLLTSGVTIFVDASENARLDEVNENRRNSSYLRQVQRGVCGLQNLGNTCFMNSALQCLSNIPRLTEYFCKKRHLEEINTDNPLGMGGKLASAYAETIESMWSGNHNSIRPAKLKYVIGEFAPRFNGYAQQDSQELTAFLLDGLHEDLNRIKKKPYIEEKEANGRSDEIVSREAWTDYKKRNDSIIVDLMHGQLKSTLVCPNCDKISIKFDPFCFLSVPVPAKERQAKSMITLLRSKKWARFAVTHTTKTTVAQVTSTIKENLGLPQEHRLVLIPGMTAFSGEILADNSILAPNAGYGLYRNYFAFIVKEGPLIIIENKAAGCSLERNLGTCPIVLNCPEELDCSFILKEVINTLQDYLFKEEECQSIISLEIVPDEVTLIHNNKSYPIKANKPFPIIEKPYGTLRMLLYWNQKISSVFKYVSLESLVDREISLTSVPKRNFTLSECIDFFTNQEQLDVNDTWFCPKCKEHRRAYKKLDLWRLPEILLIHLKRFQYTRYNREKIDTEIQIPTKDFNLADKVLDLNQKNNAMYDLIGISNHSGGLGSGHYTARARNGPHWCEFNDSYAAFSHDLQDKMNSREAYLLFYQRREQTQPTNMRKTRSSANTMLSAKSNTSESSASPTSISPSRRRISESKMDIG